jgi:hypothetical protein
MATAAIWDRIFQGRFEDRAYAEEVFYKYLEEV